MQQICLSRVAGAYRSLLALALFWTLHSQLSTVQAQGPAFTYQGRLNDTGSPANGSYDFRFRLASDPLGTNFVAGPLLTNGITVSSGLFTVGLNFGAGVFTGSNYWLEVDVRTNGGGNYTSLTPLQPLTPSPYAIMANSASNVLGTLPAAQLSGALASAQFSGTYSSAVTLSNVANNFNGAFTGNGGGITNVNAATVGGLASSNLWQIGGNNVADGQFLGSTNNQALELKVNGVRALRIEPTVNDANLSNIVNVIGGSPANFVASGIYGATISGGGAVRYFGPSGTNVVFSDFGTISGGRDNSVLGQGGTVGGGEINTARGIDNTVGGGSINVASGRYSTIGGGDNNRCLGFDSTVGGGLLNASTNDYATVPGGNQNVAGGLGSFAAGVKAKAIHDGCFVWADSPTLNGVDFASTSSNQFLIRAGGGVGIGTTSPEAPLHVANGTAGSVTANPNSIAVFEKGGNGYVSLLGPVANEIGLLFGNPNASTDGGIIYNNPSVPSGFEFRTGTNNNRMTILADGNVGIGTIAPTNKLQVIGGATFSSGSAGANQNVVWTPGSASWSFTSDRNTKDRLASVNQREVLEKVCGLSIAEWSYIGYDQRHIGPMAQDFHAQFPLNGDDKSLNDADLHGVALAAIQGLNQKLDEKEARITALEKELAELKRLVMNHSDKGN